MNKILLMISMGCAVVLMANPKPEAPDSLENTKKSVLVNDKVAVLKLEKEAEIQEPKAVENVLTTFQRNLQVNGTARVVSIYRNMSEHYGDMITSDKNISFTDYPQVLGGGAFLGGFPNLEINMNSKLANNALINVGYSMAHSFSGSPENRENKNIQTIQNLRFSGKWNTPETRLSLNVGSVLWTKMSRFTMGQHNYRDDYFDRLPWDWYRKSFLKYEEYHGLSANVGAQGAGNSAVNGFVGKLEYLPLRIEGTFIYGRTNFTAIDSRQINGFPEMVNGVRLEKNFFVKAIDARIGANYYGRIAERDKRTSIRDNNEVYTIDGNVKIYKSRIKFEIGQGRIDNPNLRNASGEAFSFKFEKDKKASPIPFSVEFYNIHKNVVSIDGSILNSNENVRGGGINNTRDYDIMTVVNAATEVGQYANNRMGTNINVEKKFGKFGAQLGYTASQELENVSNQISIQHRMAGFTRSRFRPWFAEGGNYGRIISGWRTTFERFFITDTEFNYKKGFNTVEVLLKHRVKLLGKDIVFMNMNAMSSIQDRLALTPMPGNNYFLKYLYNDLTMAVKMTNKHSFVFHGGMQTVQTSDRILMIPSNGQPTNNKELGKTANQFGKTLGIGWDYDFSSTAGFHIRHRWFAHEDSNLTLDRFKGNETMFELKIFF
ncbi:MAG: hypothetical protein SNJ77_01310 [Cytophagales bacterium]